jgi:carbon starvation protein CstA
MVREYLTAAVTVVVIGAIAILLLYLAASGMMPKGFGLFDQSNWGVRAITFVVLVAIGLGLWVAYRRARRPNA